VGLRFWRSALPPRKARYRKASSRRYNIAVLTPKSEPQAERKYHRHAVYASETCGLLMIALVLLVLTLVRYWHEIQWSLR
jgi:hypothetical protein